MLAGLRSPHCQQKRRPLGRSKREERHDGFPGDQDASEQQAVPSFATSDARWDAVLRRDRAADGVFYYSVRTTGVYCRPCCAARRPRRENVAFHPTCQEAEAAGFRPCKRCRPNEAPLAERHAAAVAEACRLIEEADETPSLDALAGGAPA